MRLIFVFLFFLAFKQFAQTNQFDFNSTPNIKNFADYLFCERDYPRAAIEYERLLQNSSTDSILFKTALSYSFIQEYSLSKKYFERISAGSGFFENAQLERMKLLFLQSDFDGMLTFYNDSLSVSNGTILSEANRLMNFSYLLMGAELPPVNEFLIPFNDFEKETVYSFYDRKNNPPLKSPIVAGILSALIPGSGKIYSGETGDGIVGFLTTAVFSFIAYDNFRAGHNTRGWIWTGVAALFYAGNVYGSVAAAQIHNAKITFEFNNELNIYLGNHNYFIPEYNFCK